MIGALTRTLRPAQWTKNVLVAAAPLAAGEASGNTIRATVIAFVAFCLMSSAVYCVNDIVDVEADRTHPVKRTRPIAAGQLSPRAAGVAAVVLAAAALVLAVATSTHRLWLALAVYAATSLVYCLGAKHLAVIELALVSSGFLLRAIAGGAAAGLPISEWFLIVAAFGSLLLVAGKRLAELIALDLEAPRSRRILTGYTVSYLRMVTAIAAGVTCTAYCLWAFEIGGVRSANWSAVSVAPFVVAVLRYTLDADAGRAEAPDVMLLRDRVLQVLGLLWLVTFAIGAFDG